MASVQSYGRNTLCYGYTLDPPDGDTIALLHANFIRALSDGLVDANSVFHDCLKVQRLRTSSLELLGCS